ncbi:MAG: tRNA glutamyl-Q(34) synthetase GluQRS [Desulfovibrio sp.]|jgi:glutamyl-tRNA synthetase|nr:tRNA glutamyl-Q(34) synthetase GluQRS [Desulfovibrio sp.]
MKGRLAPSPTGNLHLGNAFTFLLAWLSAKAQGGALVLRLEDLDPQRSRMAFALGILEDLTWLGLTWDEGPALSPPAADSPFFPEKGDFGPYSQSSRLGRYAAVLDNFARQGLLYPCFCTRRELRFLPGAPHAGDEGAPYSGACRRLSSAERSARISSGASFALRLDTAWARERVRRDNPHIPETALFAWEDALRGPQTFVPENSGDDFALRRSDGVYAYQLAVTVDDAAMGVTEVVRGDDLLSSTPRQVLLLRLLGAPIPRYAHVPLLRNGQGERLAKRHPGFALRALRTSGLSPEKTVGLLARLAGLRQTQVPLPPAALVPGFSFRSLRNRVPVLDECSLRA